MKKYVPFTTIAFIGILLFSCQPEESMQNLPEGNVSVDFSPVVNSSALELNTGNYTNAAGDAFNVSSFKFYIHHITLMNTSSGISHELKNRDYFLLDAASPSSLSIQLKVPSDQYDKMAFTLGVDSTDNVSGAQSGALDPLNGMFWTWNTGYIMAKLEGSSPSSIQPDNRFQYHIGGFRQANTVIKRIILPLPAAKTLQVKAGKTSSIAIEADINKWFQSPHLISFSNQAVIMGPGIAAQQIAENYSGMFRIMNVRNDQ